VNPRAGILYVCITTALVMDNMDNADTLNQIEHLVAEIESLKAMLQEYQYNISLKEKIIQELHLQIDSNNEAKSQFDNQAAELEFLQNYLADAKQEIAGSVYRELYLSPLPAKEVGLKYQLEHLIQNETFLQTQSAAMQFRLQELTTRNLLLQQETTLITGLLMQLADAVQERDEWKALAALREEK